MKLAVTIRRGVIVLAVTIAFVLLGCIGMIYILERGPSQTAKALFVNAVNETSRMGFVSRMFLPGEEVDAILAASRMAELEEGATNDAALVEITDSGSDIEILNVKGNSYQGKMMIIHDPSRVFCGVIPEFGKFDGMNVQEIIDTYNDSFGGVKQVIGGVNGGDFIDYGINNSFTAQPLGAVISQGKVVFAESVEYDQVYHLVGFTREDKLVMGNISINQALEMGVRDAIYCKHETGPFLVMDGEPLLESVPDSANYGGGPNPRTAIGQRSDGAVLLLVVDGRQANSLGATFKDLAYCMLDYGAINAAAMDGGTSSQMVYNGEVLNHPYSPFGPRKCPTAWLVWE